MLTTKVPLSTSIVEGETTVGAVGRRPVRLSEGTAGGISTTAERLDAASPYADGDWTFANSRTFNLDAGCGDGCSSRTIDGTLANTGAVQVRSTYNNLSVATDIELRGLTNASGESFNAYGLRDLRLAD